jgi:hypothetical protein
MKLMVFIFCILMAIAIKATEVYECEYFGDLLKCFLISEPDPPQQETNNELSP